MRGLSGSSYRSYWSTRSSSWTCKRSRIMLSSRERVNRALQHQEPDRVPLDLGASAVTGMQVNVDAAELKQQYGDRLAFWGGGVNTQHTLPFGTPDEVRQEVRERIKIFGQGGGFVFNTIHNVQALIPIENVLALYETVREYGRYPL
ncbi:MAG: hypothetical protein HY710_13135 [Candidatus Latescibacteria bacterium]|nr:hypothetical protein [Candidatus Latescibacterota bacterium]